MLTQLQKITEHYEALKAEVISLKQENMKLSDLVVKLSANKTYAEVLSKPVGKPKHVQGHIKEQGVITNNYMREEQVQGFTSEESEISVNSGEDFVPHENNEWQRVRNKYVSRKDTQTNSENNRENSMETKQRSVLVQGKRVNDKLKVTKKSPKTKAVFVTRLDPLVSCDELTTYVMESTNLKVEKCAKLKTKHSSYSSFYMSVLEKDFEKVCNPNIWPEGVLFTQFYGRLREEMIFVSENVNANEGSSIANNTGGTKANNEV
jgi:hypothetical protein